MEQLPNKIAASPEAVPITHERPTPVRTLMAAAPSATSTDQDSSQRTFEVEGEEWIARVVGSSRSGSGTDAGSPLILITFARSTDPEVYVREALGVGVALADVANHALLELFQRAVPHPAPGGPARAPPPANPRAPTRPNRSGRR